ncbi:hypothetical protein IDF66_12250 [Gordonia hankookensis]|uniref:Uncharacterized protein n=1 Tax=Gordonia hankookensis TaxID=589403 RepID=A0ABR7WER0_9ACTN|nr:hypothetical protein [Gordonia hankookensis]MBD1320357.1 hypothetical protein [Gordonia hankookensis]
MAQQTYTGQQQGSDREPSEHPTAAAPATRPNRSGGCGTTVPVGSVQIRVIVPARVVDGTDVVSVRVTPWCIHLTVAPVSSAVGSAGSTSTTRAVTGVVDAARADTWPYVEHPARTAAGTASTARTAATRPTAETIRSPRRRSGLDDHGIRPPSVPSAYRKPFVLPTVQI